MSKNIKQIEKTKRASVTEVRENLADLIGIVRFAKQNVAIEKNGQVYAYLINSDEWDKWNNYKEFIKQRALNTVESIHKRNQGVDEKELEEAIDKAVNKVRSLSK